MTISKSSPCLPTFSPLGALTFVANQLRQVLADDPKRCEELRGTWIEVEGEGLLCVPLTVAENWRNMLEAAASGLRTKG